MEIEDRHIWLRLRFTVAILLIVLIGGTFGFWLLERDFTTLLDSFFFTLVTVTTIGYGNITPQTLAGKILTMVVILSGVGAALVTIQTVFETLIKKRIEEAMRLPKSKINQTAHFIVCGYGKVGRALVQNLQQGKTPFVVIEDDASKVEQMVQSDIPVIEGDARKEDVLKRASVETAKCLLATLDDSNNVFITLTAKMLNPQLRVICKVEDVSNEAKMKKAGADDVIPCHNIGAQMMIEVAHAK